MGGTMAKSSPQAMEQVTKYIDELIATKKVFVVSKSYCPYCKKARQALMSFPLKEGSMEWLEIENREDCNEIQNYMGTLTGSRTVPRVFIGGKFFGDGTFTAKAKANGLLERTLREVGAI